MIALVMEDLGFNVQLTPLSKDGGKDIVVNCLIEDKDKRKYYIEIKHSTSKTHPGSSSVMTFVEVNAKDATNGGLFISTNGFTNAVYNRRAEFSQQQIRLGDKTKIHSLCMKCLLKKNGLWQAQTALPEILFEDTL